MIGPSLAINRNDPKDSDAEVDNGAKERVPNVHGEHDAFAEEDEHGEDGDRYVEGIERLTPHKRNRRDLHMIRIRIENLRGTRIKLIVISDLPQLRAEQVWGRDAKQGECGDGAS